MKSPASLFAAKTLLAALLLAAAVPNGLAHSGKARFHVIIDTDGAPDDLRALVMLLGNREAEVLAVTTSDGALPPAQTARRVRALRDGFHHEGIPVGVGRPAGAAAPAWRQQSAQVDWGAPDSPEHAGEAKGTNGPESPEEGFPTASALIARTLRGEEEKVVFVALGALTNVQDLLSAEPELAACIERIVWYTASADPLAGPNFEADTAAARKVLASGIRTEAVSANPARPLPVTRTLVDSIAAIRTPYAEKIARTHRTEPLATAVRTGHLGLWDDLTVLRLYRPELFEEVSADTNVVSLRLPAAMPAAKVESEIIAVLRGKPDTESRVFYGFPTDRALYAADVAPIIDSAIRRHGPSEWRAGVLTNELHGHLGIYATVGVKMGIRAREYFNIGVDDIEVTTFAGRKPPVSCMNDGLQAGTGASVGHGLITVADTDHPRPEARFTFKGKTIRLALKPEYAERIRRDVRRGIELYGDLTEAYWLYVRELALRYWLDFDRYEIFDLYVEK